MIYFSRKNKGFTLIEVLVAIAVIAAVIPSLMTLMIKQADYAGIIRDKTIAGWIAENRATELRLEHRFLGRTLNREEDNKVEMAGEEWNLKVDIDKADFWTKYTLTVEGEDNKPVTVLVTFLDELDVQ